jgi:hypothetical protein
VLRYRVCAVRSFVARSVPPGKNGSRIKAGTAAVRAMSTAGVRSVTSRTRWSAPSVRGEGSQGGSTENLLGKVGAQAREVVR